MTNDDYVRLRIDVNTALDYFIKEQNTPVETSIPGAKITKAGYVNELIIADLKRRGHYPPGTD